MITTNRKRLLVASAVLAVLLVLVLASVHHQVPVANAVTISLIGYTNGGSKLFALLCASNQAPYSIAWRGCWSEVEGVAQQKARIVNPKLPGFTIEPVLKGGRSMLIAVGEPLYEDETGRWRFDMTFSANTWRDRWWWFSLRHKAALTLGRLMHFRYRPPDPTNCVTVRSVWLSK